MGVKELEGNMSKKGGAAAAAAVGEKVVSGMIRLTVPAGKAAPAPPVGPALGQKGLNLMEFCKAFNDQTKVYKDGTPIPTNITAYSDRTFTYKTKHPPVQHMLKVCTGVPRFAKQPGKEVVGEISVRAIYEIAKVKQADMNGVTLEQACSMIVATSRRIGLKIVR